MTSAESDWSIFARGFGFPWFVGGSLDIDAIDANIGRTDTAIVNVRRSGPHTVVADDLAGDGTTLVRVVATAAAGGWSSTSTGAP